MKSVLRTGVRVVGLNLSFGLCALLATACVEGDPIPQDVIQRAEAVLLESNAGGAPVAPPPATSAAGSDSSGLPPGASALAALANPPILPEGNELGGKGPGAVAEEEAIPEDAIPLGEYFAR
jgi:hypothetical protein